MNVTKILSLYSIYNKIYILIIRFLSIRLYKASRSNVINLRKAGSTANDLPLRPSMGTRNILANLKKYNKTPPTCKANTTLLLLKLVIVTRGLLTVAYDFVTEVTRNRGAEKSS